MTSEGGAPEREKVETGFLDGVGDDWVRRDRTGARGLGFSSCVQAGTGSLQKVVPFKSSSFWPCSLPPGRWRQDLSVSFVMCAISVSIATCQLAWPSFSPRSELELLL